MYSSLFSFSASINAFAYPSITSALISFFRTLVFQVVAVLILPKLFDIDGIWYSIVVAEIMAVIFTIFFLILKRKKYQYW